MKQDIIDRSVLVVYKTRNIGYFNFSQTTFELLGMKPEARREYASMLRKLAAQIDVDLCNLLCTEEIFLTKLKSMQRGDPIELLEMFYSRESIIDVAQKLMESGKIYLDSEGYIKLNDR